MGEIEKTFGLQRQYDFQNFGIKKSSVYSLVQVHCRLSSVDTKKIAKPLQKTDDELRDSLFLKSRLTPILLNLIRID